ncbi:MAG TPA: TadE/TadG family type IV pilus assembly protein [Gaiellaceae bacterium]|jgi:Flp pilus assembly protein TadG
MRRIDLRKQNGQSMVEFALVAPVLLLLVLGIIQFGIVLNNYMALTDAVRAGSRQAAVGRTAADPIGETVDRVRGAAGHLDQSELVVTVTPPDPSTWQQGGDVTVEATYPYEISLLGLVVKSGQLTSQTTERVE